MWPPQASLRLTLKPSSSGNIKTKESFVSASFFDEEGGTFSAIARGALLTALSLPSFPREPSSPPCWCPETSQVGLLFALSLPLAEGGPDRVERE